MPMKEALGAEGGLESSPATRESGAADERGVWEEGGLESSPATKESGDLPRNEAVGADTRAK